jgi:hypothetical protein
MHSPKLKGVPSLFDLTRVYSSTCEDENATSVVCA